MGRSSSVFVSYRRDDAGVLPHAFKTHLAEYIASDRVFVDNSSITAGEAFPERIQRSLASSSVCVAFIGKAWAADGRIFNHDDWVRKELGVALSRNLKVLPVFIGRGGLDVDELPSDLRPLADKQAVWLRSESLESDMGGLVGETMRLLGEPWPPVQPSGPLYTLLSLGYTLVFGAWALLLLLFGSLFGSPDVSTIVSALLMMTAALVVLRSPIHRSLSSLSRHAALRIAATIHLLAATIEIFGESGGDVVQWLVFALLPAGGLYLGANSMQRRVRT